jgi:hypothetical protein
VEVESINVERVPGVDLRSAKYSVRHQQGTQYRFSFYLVTLSFAASLPTYLRNAKFTHNGRTFEWLTIAEMEQDPNTQNRNLDVTRYIDDNATQLLRVPPDSFSIQS